MVKRRFCAMIIIILSLAFISFIAYQDNVLREEAMAEAYLNKIWIESDWAGETYKGFYFSFNKIDGTQCEGGLGTGDLYNIYGGSYLWGADCNFSGTLHGNTAECRFVDCEGVTGSMAFIFVNDSKIEATISYDGEDITEKKTFRPYNIKDIDDLTLQEEPTVQVDLDHWGPVYFVAGIKSEEGNSWPRPRAYLVNENHDVLCEFDSSFQVGTKIYDIVFKDINGDGLKDAVVSTCFVDNGIEAKGMPHIHRLFLQTDNWFKCETAWIDPEEGTWKQEYENCMAAMEQGISERGMEGRQEQNTFKQEAWDRVMELWQDSLSAFDECVEMCIRNQSGGIDGEEDIYRAATLLMAIMCEEHNGSYELVYEHGEDMGKAREDFRAVIEGQNPIDESRYFFHEDFGIYYYADALLSRMTAEAWEEEFYHCLEMLVNEVKQSAATDEEQILEILETYKDFFEVWVDNERAYIWREYYDDVGTENGERYIWMELGRGGVCIWQAESRAEVFRTGTMLLVNGLEKYGGSYEFIYDGEAGRQDLIDLLGVCPETDEGTWEQEYAICMTAMERSISEYTSISFMPYEYLQGSDKVETDRSKELWQDSLSAFGECVETCIKNQSGTMYGEEDIYRMAVFLMKVMCERSNGHYTFAHAHGEDLEKAQEDFKEVIDGENPIDESTGLFYEEFGSYYGADLSISAMMSEAWQEEFYHCLDLVRDRVKQSGAADQEQVLAALKAWEDFFEVWADNEEEYEHIEAGTGMNIFIAESRAEVFRIGTMLLIDGLEKSGYSYEFVYDSEPDRQKLTERYSE